MDQGSIVYFICKNENIISIQSKHIFLLAAHKHYPNKIKALFLLAAHKYNLDSYKLGEFCSRVVSEAEWSHR